MESDYMEKTSNPFAIMAKFSIEILENKINEIDSEIITKESELELLIRKNEEYCSTFLKLIFIVNEIDSNGLNESNNTLASQLQDMIDSKIQKSKENYENITAIKNDIKKLRNIRFINEKKN